MNDDDEILKDFHQMDDARRRQVRLMLHALALEFPRKLGLSLVRPVVNDGLGKRAENDERCGLLRLAERPKLTQ